MSRLRALFTGREKYFQEVEHTFPDGGVQREAELLLARCEQLGIEGVDKFGAAVGSPDKFMSMLSEVRTAILFARLGASVRILRDEEFGRPRRRQPTYYTPDLSVTFGDLSILVEVFRSNPATPDISTPLDRGIKERGLPFSVEYRLGEELSVPGFGRDEREKHETLTREIIDEVLQKLSALAHGSSGEILVGKHRFLYKPSKLDRGYAAGGVTAAHWVNIEKHEKKLLEDLNRKANRRASLPLDKQGTPFVVAYESWESELRESHVRASLAGNRNSYLGMKPPPVEHPLKVMDAWNSPWQPLLQEWDYGPDAECRLIHCEVVYSQECSHNAAVDSTGHRLPHYGSFDGSEWAKNLSGVLVVHGRHGIQWLPNPFAAESIREVRLLDIGLSFAKDGDAHPDTLE